MSSTQRTLIHAELLSNIRQVSIGCSLPTPSSSATLVTVSSEGWLFTVCHDGNVTSVSLPGRVASLPRLPVKKIGSTSLSWRLPLRGPVAANGHSAALAPSAEESVPWSARDLEPDSAIRCRTCEALVVGSYVLKLWKDLPSENWAEMMEFWHCHKPHNHHHGQKDDEGLTTSKAYGASRRISAQPGVGFVDLTSFLLCEADVDKSCISTASSTLDGGEEDRGKRETKESLSGTAVRNSGVHCSKCESRLGVLQEEASSISLFKWAVAVEQLKPESTSLSSLPLPSPPTLPQCVSAVLLATMARSGCSKSIILPLKIESEQAQNTSSSSSSLLNIWVFNGNIRFSSTEEPRSPINAVKVFYRTVSQDEADKMMDSMTSDVQDIFLPADAIGEVRQLLDRSNGFVPQSERHFQGWTVGFLEKWDVGTH